VGAAVTGPMKGAKLKPMQSIFTRWETWKGLYPTSKVLSSGKRSLFGSVRDPYESYYSSSETGIIPPRLLDKRIYPKEFVLGIVLNGKAKAYPFSVLSRQSVVNDAFEKVPLLIVFDEETTTGMIFRRKLGGKTLAFKKTSISADKGFFLVDDVSQSVWQAFTGTAIEGPTRGKKLEALPITPSFWFGWVDHYPKTELFALKK